MFFTLWCPFLQVRRTATAKFHNQKLSFGPTIFGCVVAQDPPLVGHEGPKRPYYNLREIYKAVFLQSTAVPGLEPAISIPFVNSARCPSAHLCHSALPRASAYFATPRCSSCPSASPTAFESSVGHLPSHRIELTGASSSSCVESSYGP